jgi:hypothetical protein
MATFWAIASRLIELDWRFRGAYCLHHQCTLDRPHDGGSMNLWNIGILLQDYTAISRKIIIFILATARNLNLYELLAVKLFDNRFV